MSSRVRFLILLGVLLCGAAMCVSTEWFAYSTNGTAGFPLDDPWIHLQFAKNLHDYGTFSYYKNEMVTSGSTSPLYTLLLAAGFFFTSNEMILSYVLGILFLVLAGWMLFESTILMFGGDILFAGTALLLLLFEPRLEWVALSGMETTLFIFLLLAVLYCYKTRKIILLGIGAGLLLWTRPDAILFLLILAADAVYHTFLVKSVDSKKKPRAARFGSLAPYKISLLIAAAFGVAYIGFNMVLSGSLFPNTYAAKIKYYSSGVTDFPFQVFHFLIDEHFQVLAFFVAIGALSLFYALFKRRPTNDLIPFLWSFGLFLAYWKNLPYLYQEGRYLMPILPFVILLGLRGIRTALDAAMKVIGRMRKHRTAVFITSAVLAVIAVQFVMASWEYRTSYAEYCKYIDERQVHTAKWLRDHLPANAVIATHDIGAIAFYSGRKIEDMVGLVSPEMINNIGRLDKLTQFLVKKKVTHLAVLRNWFEIVNQNSIYQTDEQHPEIMEVYEFDPVHTHITPREASSLNDEAAYYLSIGNVRQAGPLLEQSLRIDSQSSKTHLLLGNALLVAGKLDNAETELNTALRLHPLYWDAQLGLAQISARRNKPQEAVAQIETIVQQNPSYVPGYRTLAQLYRAFHLDSTRAEYYLQKYNQLARGPVQ